MPRLSNPLLTASPEPDPVGIDDVELAEVPRSLPPRRTLASAELTDLVREKNEKREKRSFHPPIGGGPRFSAVKALSPTVTALLAAAFGPLACKVNLPEPGSLVSMSDYARLLSNLPNPLALSEPITDQQPGESGEEFALFQAYCAQFNFVPRKPGRREQRSIGRLREVFGCEAAEGQNFPSGIPDSYLHALCKAWSWEYRATIRDSLIAVGEQESHQLLLGRQQAKIKEEFNATVLATLRASRNCIESGDPKMARDHLLAFNVIFGQKGVGDFLLKACGADAAETAGGKPTISISQNGNAHGKIAVGIEWGAPPTEEPTA